MNTFKNYREKELIYFSVVNLIVFYYTAEVSISIVNFYEIYTILINAGFVGTLIYLSTLILDFLIPENLKNNFLWYFPKTSFKIFRLPGEFIFDFLKEKKDIRIDRVKAIKKYDSIYKNMPRGETEKFQYQNNRFYEIFLKHEKGDKVVISHKEYLLCRDMVTQMIAHFIICNILNFVKIVKLTNGFYLYCLGVYTVLLFCARQRAKAYVKNVIIRDLYECKDD